MAQLLKNNAFSTLALPLASGATSMTLVDASGFPSPTGGDYFLATLVGYGTNGAENAWEIVRCTARASNTLTVVRAQEGTADASWSAATQVQMRLTAGSMATKADLASPAFTGTVNGITKAMVGLSNADNTADTAKPVSTAQQAALDLKANLAGPAFTGAPTAPTAATGTNTTQVATTAFVNAEIASDAAPIAHVGSGGAAHANAVASGAAGFMTGADKAKLDGVAAGANNYSHPANHPPSIITQDASNRFVTDAEKSAWNAKQAALVSGTNIKSINGSSVLGSGNIDIAGGITDAPSDGKQYARKDAAWAEVSGLSVGDFMTTMRALSAPDWLAPDGSAYLQASYPELFSLLGLAANDMFAAKLTVPSAPSSTITLSKWSADGKYLGFASTGSPYLWVYSRSGTTLTKLPNPSPTPAGAGNDCAFDGAGAFVALAHNASPYISVYQISGSSVTKIADPATLPTGNGNGCSWDDSGTFLAVAHEASPFITVYERSGTTLTKLPNPASLPPAACKACQWDASGKYLVVAHTNSPFITVYERSGTTLTKLPNPASLPEGNGNGAACDASGTLFSVAIGVSPYIVTYRREGSTLSRLANPATLPAGVPVSCSWTREGRLLGVAHSNTPFVTVYERASSTLTKIANPASLPATSTRGCAFASNGAFLAVTSPSSPYAEVYRNSNYDTATSFVVPSYAAPAVAPAYMKAKP